MNEGALYRTVGGTKVTGNQLFTLLERADLPNVDLRVLPFDAGTHPANEGSFAIVQFPDLLANVSFDDVVLVEYRAGAVYLEKQHEIEPFSRIFQHVQDQALTPGESVQRVRSERYEG